MTTRDEIVLEVYNGMKNAFAQGNAFAYANEIAGRILQAAPVRTEPVVEQPVRTVQPIQEEARSRTVEPHRSMVNNTRTDSIRVNNL